MAVHILYQINLIKRFLIELASRGTETSRYKSVNWVLFEHFYYSPSERQFLCRFDSKPYCVSILFNLRLT